MTAGGKANRLTLEHEAGGEPADVLRFFANHGLEDIARRVGSDPDARGHCLAEGAVD